MSLRIKAGLAVLTILAAQSYMSTAALAAFPDRPVHLVVGYSPGGGSDIMTRIIGKALSERWKQPVLVENRPGADGAIAEDYVAHAAPDGYTIIMVTNGHAMPPETKRNYDPVKSFAPVSLADAKPMVLLMNPAVPANSMKELIAYAKANPGKLNYGSSGPTTDPTILTMMLMQKTGIQLTNIAYKGGGDSQVAVAGGEIQLLFGTASAGLGQIKSGQLKALAVTANVRSDVLPDVPTMAEAANLPGFNETVWNGILAPAGTPKAIVDQMSKDIAAAMKAPEMKKTLAEQDVRPIGSTPAEFATFIADERSKLAALFKEPAAK